MQTSTEICTARTKSKRNSVGYASLVLWCLFMIIRLRLPLWYYIGAELEYDEGRCLQ